MYFNISHKYPAIKKKKVTSFEHGAHFPYIEVYNRLTNLINELPADRFGRDGVYFQDDTNQRIMLKSRSMGHISKVSAFNLTKVFTNRNKDSIFNLRYDNTTKSNLTFKGQICTSRKDLFQKDKLSEIMSNKPFAFNSSLSKNGYKGVSVNSNIHLIKKEMFLPRINNQKKHERSSVINKLSTNKLFHSQSGFNLKFDYSFIKPLHCSLGFNIKQEFSKIKQNE